MRHSTRKSEQDLEISVVVMSLGNHGVQFEYKLSLFEDLNRSNVYAAVMLPSKLRISVPPSLHSLLMSLFVGSWYCNCHAVQMDVTAHTSGNGEQNISLSGCLSREGSSVKVYISLHSPPAPAG